MLHIHDKWKIHLQSEFNKPYFNDLMKFVESEYTQNICYPEKSTIFSAFNACAFEDIKVVIIGQDPYHGPNQANGLCFSVMDEVAHPPSLVNIFKEIKANTGKEYPKSGNLERWANQGVLLLNATLTVRANEAGSHQKKGWETFTDAIIKLISEKQKGVIFLLWGGFAKKKEKLISSDKHIVLKSGHPSPLSANRGYWFGNNHFSSANKILLENKTSAIDW